MAEVLVPLGREADAVTTLQRGVEAAPDESKLRKLLALRLINLKRYPEAEIVMRDYVRIFPEDQFMRGLLEKATGGRQ